MLKWAAQALNRLKFHLCFAPENLFSNVFKPCHNVWVYFWALENNFWKNKNFQFFALFWLWLNFCCWATASGTQHGEKKNFKIWNFFSKCVKKNSNFFLKLSGIKFWTHSPKIRVTFRGGKTLYPPPLRSTKSQIEQSLLNMKIASFGGVITFYLNVCGGFRTSC